MAAGRGEDGARGMERETVCFPLSGRPGPEAVSETCTSLLDPFLREERLAAVTAPHVAALNRWVSGLRQHGVELPWFDPADGGTGAGLLVLLQSPARSSPSPGLCRGITRGRPSRTWAVSGGSRYCAPGQRAVEYGALGQRRAAETALSGGHPQRLRLA
ncbi:hypothetical protein [Pantoea sp. SGAir0180]